MLTCATVTLVKKTWFAYGQSRAICTALGKGQPGSVWPPSDFQRLDVVVGRLCLKAILMWSTTREKILGTRRRAHLHYGSWRQRQVHCGSWRQSQCLFPALYRTMRSGKPWLFVGLISSGNWGISCLCVPWLDSCQASHRTETSLRLTSAEGPWLFQLSVIASAPPLVFLLPHPNRDFPSDWFSLASNKLQLS